MITVIIHCKEDIAPLADTLAMLVSGAVHGLVSEVILWSEHNSIVLKTIADDTGCNYFANSCFVDAVKQAKNKWILFLGPGARLLDQWREIISRYIATEVKPVSFQSVMPRRVFSFATLFRQRSREDTGLLILKEQIIALNITNNEQRQKSRKLKPVILPVQIITPEQIKL
ncbi:hypothetical protein [uncultured Bartonella sp.]|uniref:hypothetical protein n=1 Tax=uncultured Bartonella sp. TaxID=104108 RepID=UPI002637E010|nr:hypothetical protein [uncultured Bartonella sp.]